MKLWIRITLLTVSLLILSGCVAKVKPQTEVVTDGTLGIIELTKNGTIADMDAIAFELMVSNNQRVSSK